MKKLIYLFILLLMSFNSKVYAFTYEVSVDIGSGLTSVSAGSTQNISINIENIHDVNKGVMYCDFEIHTTGGVELNAFVQPSNEWSIINNGFYALKAKSPIIKDTEMVNFPIKVNSAGTLSVIGIKCYDGTNSIVSVADIYTKFTIDTDKNTNDNEELISSDYISGFKLSEVFSRNKIKFNPNIKTYEIEIGDFENLLITPILKDDTMRYSVIKEDEGKKVAYVIITALDGSRDIYTIYMTENSFLRFLNIISDNIIIILLVICVLLLIIYRKVIVKFLKVIFLKVKTLKKKRHKKQKV